MYWATGLTRVYLEGALARATAGFRVVAAREVDVEPAYPGPAPSVIVDRAPTSRAVLDPFAVFAQGEGILRQELAALDVDHLHAIIHAYALGGGIAAESVVPNVLVEYIVATVRAQSLGPADVATSAKPSDNAL
jgi:hypothetical protein